MVSHPHRSSSLLIEFWPIFDDETQAWGFGRPHLTQSKPTVDMRLLGPVIRGQYSLVADGSV